MRTKKNTRYLTYDKEAASRRHGRNAFLAEKEKGPKDRNKTTKFTSIEGSTWLAHQVKASYQVVCELVMPRY